MSKLGMVGTLLRRRDTLKLVVHFGPVRIRSAIPVRVAGEVEIRPCEQWCHCALMEISIEDDDPLCIRSFETMTSSLADLRS